MIEGVIIGVAPKFLASYPFQNPRQASIGFDVAERRRLSSLTNLTIW